VLEHKNVAVVSAQSCIRAPRQICPAELTLGTQHSTNITQKLSMQTSRGGGPSVPRTPSCPTAQARVRNALHTCFLHREPEARDPSDLLEAACCCWGDAFGGLGPRNAGTTRKKGSSVSFLQNADGVQTTRTHTPPCTASTYVGPVTPGLCQAPSASELHPEKFLATAVSMNRSK